MDVPLYLRVLWSYRWLLLVGLVVSVIAALLAGYTVKDGALESRAAKIFTASTTILVGSPRSPLFQSEIPGTTIEAGVTAPVTQDLAASATVYAYLISGNDTEAKVEAIVGPLSDTESITSVSRTTQPNGNEAFPGRLELPIVDVVGTSPDAARAEEISRAASTVFQAYVVEQQNAANIPAEQRVQLSTIKENGAVEGVTSNPLLPVILTGLGVFIGFIALSFILHNVRINREKRNARKRATRDRPSPDATASTGVSPSPEPGTDGEPGAFAELIGSGSNN